jgi:hypothetical protein
VLPSARLHWHRARMRRRRVKLVLAGVGMLGLLVALLDVVLEPMEAPLGDSAESSWEDGPRPASGNSGKNTSGKNTSGQGKGSAWFSTLGGEP